jgi:CTP:molybdopterin cytidylyltransferase MocA
VIVGILLAAGASTRMGRPKALVASRGQSFLVRGVRALWSACDRVIVVLGADADRIQRAAGEEFETLVERGLLAPDLSGGPAGRSGELEVRFVNNPRWRQGMVSSVRAGLSTALRSKPRGMLVLPVDHPEVTAATVQSLGRMLLEALGAFGGRSASSFAYALVPRRRGRRGHPVALSAGLASAIARDRQARALADAIRSHARLDVTDNGILVNLNTPGGRSAARPPARPRAAGRATARPRTKAKVSRGARARRSKPVRSR